MEITIRIPKFIIGIVKLVLFGVAYLLAMWATLFVGVIGIGYLLSVGKAWA